MAKRVVADYLQRLGPDDATPAPHDRLTPREREVLQLAAEGLTTREIAEQLVVSTKTAEHHRASAMAKLNLHSQTELVKYAIRSGLIEAGARWVTPGSFSSGGARCTTLGRARGAILRPGIAFPVTNQHAGERDAPAIRDGAGGRRGQSNVMDEYRPFPSESEQPPDEPADEALDDTPETDPDQDLDPEMEMEAEVEAPRPMAERDERDDGDDRDAGAGRQERAAPNLDHPGGHLHGTVARLNKPGRFGFLRADDGVEVFFHASAINSGPERLRRPAPGAGGGVRLPPGRARPGPRGLRGHHHRRAPPGAAPAAPAAPGGAGRAGHGAGAPAGRRRLGGERWHVAVLRERFDMPVATQLERLLNERVVKPGNFTLGFVDREEGVDCWVAYFSAVEGS